MCGGNLLEGLMFDEFGFEWCGCFFVIFYLSIWMKVRVGMEWVWVFRRVV